MRFTHEQYLKAMANIGDACLQLEPDGRSCSICGDSGHMAWQCGSNPLLAWALCNDIAKKADEIHERMHKALSVHDEVPKALEEIHEFLHYLSGHNTWMGESVGPRKMRPIEDP